MQSVRFPPALRLWLATQLSQLLNVSSQDHSATVDQHRQLADMLEKGDTRALGKMRGQRVLAWAPSDSNALARLMAAILRQPDPQLRPVSLAFLAPIPHFPGLSSPDELFDLWWHPLLGQKPEYAALVRNVDLILQPVEYVLPGHSAPRHVRQGLACFIVSPEGVRTTPAICPR